MNAHCQPHYFRKTLKDYIFILLVTGLYTVVANTFGYNGDLAQGAVGILVIVAIAFFGVVIQMLPGFNKLPVVFWVSLTAVIVSIPSFPGGVWIVEQTKHINFLATTTPILAYGGLCLGQGPRGLKRLSWRIVPVAMAVRLGQLPLRHRARRADAAPRGASSDPRSDNRSTMDRNARRPRGGGRTRSRQSPDIERSGPQAPPSGAGNGPLYRSWTKPPSSRKSAKPSPRTAPTSRRFPKPSSPSPNSASREVKTSRKVQEALERLGIEFTAGHGITGVKARSEGRNSKRTVAMLAELDAIVCRTTGTPTRHGRATAAATTSRSPT